MPLERLSIGTEELERCVAAFEAAWSSGKTPDPSDFLPPASATESGSREFRQRILVELLRVDLEFRHDRGESAGGGLSRYEAKYPELFADRGAIAGLAFEEFRLRDLAGERPDVYEYERKYGISTDGWKGRSKPSPSAIRTDVYPDIQAAANTSPTRFPLPGERFGEFKIVSELGRGTFGRVFRAEQLDLSHRPVAIKISTQFGRNEPETLARLQHAHIVPVYSTHRVGPYQVTVMPFLGATTLADLNDAIQGGRDRPRSGRTILETIADRQSATRVDPNPTATPQTTPLKPVSIEAYTKGNFPEAVLWIVARLAEGLGHAHERGIIHQDIKPANILLTDDGLPMLLDFNLANDGQSDRAMRGGTPAYMAPEQWAAVQNRTDIPADPRVDLYSLAAVAYELLTGKRPVRDAVNPSIRSINAAVSPSADAIVMKCLSQNPEQRYRNAAELADDLNRHSRNEPLRFVREPSIRERLSKWSRRHPRLSSSGSIAAISFVAVLAVGWVAKTLTDRVHQLDGQQQALGLLKQYYSELPAVTESLAFRGSDASIRSEANGKREEWKRQFGDPAEESWPRRFPASYLSQAEQVALRNSLSEMELLSARAETDANVALSRYDRAIEGFQWTDGVPGSVFLERNALRRRLGLPEVDSGANSPKQSDGREEYLIGLYHRQQGRLLEAKDSFERASSLDPKHYWSWFSLGATRFELGELARAEGHFDACIALKPEWPMGYFNRGLVRMQLGRTADAILDFSQVLRLDETHEDALYHRGLALASELKAHEAKADFDRLVERKPTVRALVQRARIRQQFFNDTAGAERDRRQMLTLNPASEVDYVSRGQVRAENGDPKGALADFDAALAINSRSFPALQNKAYVLSAKLQKDEDSIRTLNRELELFPDSLPARAGRAVLLARKNQRDAAHADANACRKIGLNAEATYQMANVYALTSRTHADDSALALRYLSESLKMGYGFQHLENDTDLDPLRTMPEFAAIVKAAKVIESQSNRRKEQP